jgi:prophage regulatory protein
MENSDRNRVDSLERSGLLRLKGVLKIIPVCAGTWRNGVRDGRFPQPVKLGPNITCWRVRDVLALVNGEPDPPEGITD